MKITVPKWLMIAFISILTTSFVHSQNNALNFDGTDDYVDCGNILPLSYTAEAWIYITDLSKANNIISGDGGSLHAFWAPSSSGTKLSAGHSGNFNEVEDPAPLVANVWYHVAVTYDAATTTMKLYKNGTLVSYNTTVQPFINPAARIYIGNFNAGLYVFAGNIDEVRIWDVARTASDIANSKQTSFTTPQPNLLANYRCNQGVANGNNTTITRLTDDSGNNRHGIFSGFTLTGNTSNFVGGSPVEPVNAIDPNKCYAIINKKSGKVLEVLGAANSNFARIIQNATNGASNQKWRFISLGSSGHVKIVAQHSCKVVSNDALTNNSTVFQSPYTQGGHEDWKIEPLSNGYYKITQRKSGRVLSVLNASVLNAAQIVLRDWSGNDSQVWQIVEVTFPTKRCDLDDDDDDDEDDRVTQQANNTNRLAETQRNVLEFTTAQGLGTDNLTVGQVNPSINAPAQIVHSKKAEGIRIYPNPATEAVWIDLTSFEGREVTLVLSDLAGKTMHQAFVQKATTAAYPLDLSNIQTGLYLINVHEQGKRVGIQKIQVTR